MYSFSKTVMGDYESTKEKTIAALQEQGFAVLTEINVKAIIEEAG